MFDQHLIRAYRKLSCKLASPYFANEQLDHLFPPLSLLQTGMICFLSLLFSFTSVFNLSMLTSPKSQRAGLSLRF